MIVLSNNTAGLVSSPATINILFALHLLAFVAMAAAGFITWLVVRVTDHLQGLRTYLVASTALVNCVFGTPTVLVSMVNVADSGSWWHGRESCLLGQVLEACVHAGSSWVLVGVVLDHWVQYRYPAVYNRFNTRRARWVVPLLWAVGCVIGILSVVSSTGSFYTKESVYDSWICAPSPENHIFTVVMLILGYILPMVITFAIYIWLVVKVRQMVDSQVIPINGSNEKAFLVNPNSPNASPELSTIRQSPYMSSRGSMTASPAIRSVSQPNIKTGPAGQMGQIEEKVVMRPGSADTRTHLSLQVHHGTPRNSVSLCQLDGPLLDSLWLKVPAKLQPLTPPKMDALEAKVPPWFGRPLSGIPSSTGTSPALRSTHRRSSATDGFPESIASTVSSGSSESNSVSSQSEAIQNGKDAMKRAAPSNTVAQSGANTQSAMACQPTRFLYRRDELPKDGNNWPTVFLTADTVDDYALAEVENTNEPQQANQPNQRTIQKEKCVPGPPEVTDHVVEGIIDTTERTSIIRRIKVRPIHRESPASPAVEIIEDYSGIKRLCFLLIPHLLLWLPHHVVTTAIVANSSFDISFEVFVFIELVGKIAMIVNPLIFFLSCGDFRNAFVNILRCRDPNCNVGDGKK